LQYPLGPDSVVFDLGGYNGDFASEINRRYGATVFLFEPVPEFYDRCVARFAGNAKIRSFDFGLSDRSGELPIAVVGDGSSFLRQSTSRKVVGRIEAFPDVVLSLGLERIDLLKINIEGGEYDLLPAIINAGLVERIDHIQVQFHDFVDNATEKRDLIRRALSLTHRESWCFPFVWESWARKEQRPCAPVDPQGAADRSHQV